MAPTIAEIASALGAEAVGDTTITVSRVSEPGDAAPDDLALAMKPEYAEHLSKGAARAAMLWPDADWQALGLRAAILPRRPRFALSGLSAIMDQGQGFDRSIHPSAVIDPTATLADDVSVGPFTVISAGARIGAGSVIGPQCFIGRDAVLGDGSFLREQVSIGARVRIGARFIGQPGARIGGDGFSFVTAEQSGVEAARESLGRQADSTEQPWARIHSLGSVQIGDDVEIGSNTTIDCGTIRNTIIGDGCKFDNLVQVGHNVVMGRDCLICGHVGIAGSTRIGNNVVLGGMTGVSDNIFIGDRVITGGGTKVLSNVPAGRVVLGYPAAKMDTQIDIFKAVRRLPRMVRDIAALQKAVFKSGSTD
ncbi:UDP-3-O-(3-hydroxymyristoyl)glucosamine N-acyltransferase [Sulfitobacter sabulilitoris]|uniref:UDP-3-O-(3-hydroxymyristoyl)glucosamine N-acyltransferase n=1 Tax=Sulfitobacter sabulilitoris TaxID=2562655 RepID=A0A5S3PJX1_9RHOB|nr:UDP-3-O-(3-hydroxymyristoyl)glucosamine N-acyltransferase [Sulfitobacter sabulilitoris]TMM54601.1 UDP-3-O-(3-hydroxymyristoyl)glucosamine N-acyltransferase [Sulfitobacter sabulilitoris]